MASLDFTNYLWQIDELNHLSPLLNKVTDCESYRETRARRIEQFESTATESIWFGELTRDTCEYNNLIAKSIAYTLIAC
jgi:hypothetical protein